MSPDNFGAVIFSRLDSSRFPQKALYPFGKVALIEAVINRIVHPQKYLTVLATSDRAIDNPLELIAYKNKIPCFRGDAQNVAERALNCAKYFGFQWFARVNGDSPFAFRSLIDEGFSMACEGDYDLVSNLMHRTYPYGISVEIIKTSAMENGYIKFSKPEHFEHITSYFYENKQMIKIGEFAKLEQDHSGIHLTVDTPEDHHRLVPVWHSIYEKNLSVQELVEKYNEVVA